MSAATDLAVSRCKVSEGFRPTVYLDTVGKRTIGYGCNLDAGWSEWLAAQVLALQLQEAEADCDGQPWYTAADAVRQSVLVELRFEMGLGGLLQFHEMLAACEAQDWAMAGAQLQASAWFTQVGTRGPPLVRLLANGG